MRFRVRVRVAALLGELHLREDVEEHLLRLVAGLRVEVGLRARAGLG